MNNQGWDKEYSTQYLKEVDYLTKLGFKWTFAKTNDFGIKVYKYTKSKKLFKVLSEFYD